MKKRLLKLLKAKQARKKELADKAEETEEVKELRSINEELTTLNNDIKELREMIDSLPDDGEGNNDESAEGEGNSKRSKSPEESEGEGGEEGHEGESRGAAPKGSLNPLGTYGIQQNKDDARAKKLLKESEKRGKALKEGRSVTVGSSNILLPTKQANDIRPTFNEISGLIDGVSSKSLLGGESYQQPYVTGYGTGDYTAEEADYNQAEVTFGYANINKAKVTAYAEDTEELQKLPAAAYDAEVKKGVKIASRKKISREILVGTGATNHISGIFSSAADAIDSSNDMEIVAIDEDTLDKIVFSYGGDEDVEDAAVLILSKLDLKAFAMLRDADGKKIYDIKTNGNKGTIDTIPFMINSACKAISDSSVAQGSYSMAYGPLSNYQLTIFSKMDIQRSTDYKFKQGMIAHKSSVFVGGNVVSKDGFLRVKKG